jgi:hypothetical protein
MNEMLRWLFDTRPSPVRKGLMSQLMYDMLKAGMGREISKAIDRANCGEKSTISFRGKSYRVEVRRALQVIGQL